MQEQPLILEPMQQALQPRLCHRRAGQPLSGFETQNLDNREAVLGTMVKERPTLTETASFSRIWGQDLGRAD